MSFHLLDTNIWIALARGEPGVVTRLRRLDSSQVAVCSVVRAELMFGARKPGHPELDTWRTLVARVEKRAAS